MLPVIFLPGLMGTEAVYTDVLPFIEREASVVSLPDLDDFDAIVDDIIGQLPAKCILCGLSMGSYLSISIAKKAPEKIKGLVLIGSTASADTEKGAEIRFKTVEWARKNGLEALARAQADSLLADVNRDNPKLLRMLVEMGDEIGLDTFARHQKALANRRDQTADLKGINCPALVITGSQDTVNPPMTGESLAAELPNARFLCMENTGHLPPMEAPQEVANVIIAFAGLIKEGE